MPNNKITANTRQGHTVVQDISDPGSLRVATFPIHGAVSEVMPARGHPGPARRIAAAAVDLPPEFRLECLSCQLFEVAAHHPPPSEGRWSHGAHRVGAGPVPMKAEAVRHIVALRANRQMCRITAGGIGVGGVGSPRIGRPCRSWPTCGADTRTPGSQPDWRSWPNSRRHRRAPADDRRHRGRHRLLQPRDRRTCGRAGGAVRGAGREPFRPVRQRPVPRPRPRETTDPSASATHPPRPAVDERRFVAGGGSYRALRSRRQWITLPAPRVPSGYESSTPRTESRPAPS